MGVEESAALNEERDNVLVNTQASEYNTAVMVPLVGLEEEKRDTQTYSCVIFFFSQNGVRSVYKFLVLFACK